MKWVELFQFGLQNYIMSLRDVIRYSNVFLLKYELLKDETDPVDLLGLTSLQVFEPSLYSKLPYYKDTLCGSNYDPSFILTTEQTSSVSITEYHVTEDDIAKTLNHLKEEPSKK